MKTKLLRFVIVVTLLCGMLTPAALAAARLNPGVASAPSVPSSLQQFSAGGHVLGFQASGATIASASHALRIEFVGANDIQPQSSQPASAGKQAQPLGQVTWRNLWDGVSLTYQAAEGGIVESVYVIEAGADAAQIRLRYNVPMALNADGSLALSLDQGQMTESAPLAWQDINGRRVPVEVAFTLTPGPSPEGRVGFPSPFGAGVRSEGGEVGFALGSYDSTYSVTIDPTLAWTTFVGGGIDGDFGYGMAVDANGNTYVTGYSMIRWGSPVRDYSAELDAFVVKLDSSGVLQWSTFLGGWGRDTGNEIAVDPNGNVFVAGDSSDTWGTPVRPYAGNFEGWAAKLNAAGELQWNTFLGSSSDDQALGIAVNSSGNPYVTGTSHATWGTPVMPHSGGYDAFVAKLVGTTGAIGWSTFAGGAGDDYGHAIAVTQTTLYIAGRGNAAWGDPMRAYSAGIDAFAAKLNPTNGALQWNTFLGGTGDDRGYGMALDGDGNVYVAGSSAATWGTPVRAYTDGEDGFAAKLDSTGLLVWHTFQGGEGNDADIGIAADAYGYVYVTGGTCVFSWGSPLVPFSGECAAHLAQLNAASGALTWNTFLNGVSSDASTTSYALATDSLYVYMAGYSTSAWGSPMRAFTGNPDAFAARISLISGNLIWNTFLGASADEFVLGLAVDSSGNTYVTGYSNTPSFADPIIDYWWKNDAFVARLDATGALVWSTFLGGNLDDYGYSISLIGGDLYVTGSSGSSWGSPLRPFTAGGSDAFVARLDADTGALVWNTFLGGTGGDSGYSLMADESGLGAYLVGYSSASWGSPVRAFTASSGDAFAAKLNASGALVWNTFLGGTGSDSGYALTIDTSGSLEVAGISNATWESPVQPISAGFDAFVARLSQSTGDLQWNTFLGGSGTDEAKAIAFDSYGNLLVAGDTTAGWAEAAQDFPAGGGGGTDAFVAQVLIETGVVNWTTYVGGTGHDYATSVARDLEGNIYLAGNSDVGWGASAMNAPQGGGDGTPAFVVRLDRDGNLNWSSFMGGAGGNYAIAVAVDLSHNVYVGGYSSAAWGSGPSSYTTGWDGFVARLDPNYLVFLPLTVK